MSADESRNECPECDYFARAIAQYPETDYPTIARQLARARAAHEDDEQIASLEAARAR